MGIPVQPSSDEQIGRLRVLYLRWAKRVPQLVAVLLAGFIGKLVATLVWDLVPPPSKSWTIAPIMRAEPQSSSRVDLDVIVAAHLFGEYIAPSSESAEASKEPEIPLNLTVIGVFAYEADEKRSRVLLASSDDSGKPYAIGDAVQDGVNIKEILSDRITILHNGRTETLLLNPDQPVSNISSASGEPLPETKVAIARTQMAKNLPSVATYIRTQPNIADGRIHGIRVFPGQDRSLFDATGLRPGDVVVALNGVSLNDASQTAQVARSFGTSGQLSVVVDRGGDLETLTFSAAR